MKPLSHVAASAATAAAVYVASRSPALSAANFLAGVLIDFDHVPEYFIKYRFQKSLSQWLTEETHHHDRKTVLILHSFDLLTALFGAAWFLGFTVWAWAVYLGMMTHLLLDQMTNPIRSPWSYFLIYRILKKFNTEAVFKQCRRE